MSEYKIELQKFRAKGSKVFTGRDRGEQVRKLSEIDNVAEQNEHLTIVIPEGIYSVNPSFLEEFLVNVVLKYGKDNFNKKFNFISEGSYNISKDLAEAIDRIIRTDNALA
jgi:hypothetical protein